MTRTQEDFNNRRDTTFFENIPEELKTLPQWVGWRKQAKPDGGFTKIPLDAKTGKNASVSDTATWAAYHVALNSYEHGAGDGIGFVLTDEDSFCGIDLDHCRDPDTGHLAPWAAEVVKRCNSYTEVTPSGAGVRIWLKATLPGTGGNNGKGFEIYDRRRFFTLTGEHIGGMPTTNEERQDLVDALYREHFPQKLEKPHFTNGTKHSAFSDAERAAILAELKDALSSIPAVEHDTWLHTGMGIHSVDASEAGLDTWVQWSQTCPEKFDLADCHKRWRSFHGGGVTHKTIFALAHEHGWRNTGPQHGTTPEVPQDHFRCTDLGNGERLVARHGADLLFCNSWNTWLLWNGQHWKKDHTQQVRQWARGTIRGIYDETQRVTEKAKNAESGEEKDKLVKRATALLQHAVRSEAEPRVNAMVHNAQMDCPVMPEDLDVDPWLLNVANGTLDLRTGTLQPHRREDRLTKMIPLTYDPLARCPQWEAFLEAIMDDSQELVDFLWKAIGYSLTGDCREDCLFLLHGVGENGKSTLLETIRAVLGEYARQAEFSTFLYKERDSVRNDVADLRGARFVSAVEVAKGRRLAEALVKSLTGRDTVKARFLFQEHFEFRPQLKLWLAANNKPLIHGVDEGIWRRIRLVPFSIQFVKGVNRDSELPEKLKTELPGILAWAVRGCLQWQADGLPMPEAVQVATAAYRKEMDVMGNFLEECCEQKPHLRVKAGDLYNAYVNWSGDKDMKQTAFGRELTDRGIEPKKTGGTVWRLGIALTTAQDS